MSRQIQHSQFNHGSSPRPPLINAPSARPSHPETGDLDDKEKWEETKRRWDNLSRQLHALHDEMEEVSDPAERNRIDTEVEKFHAKLDRERRIGGLWQQAINEAKARAALPATEGIDPSRSTGTPFQQFPARYFDPTHVNSNFGAPFLSNPPQNQPSLLHPHSPVSGHPFPSAHIESFPHPLSPMTSVPSFLPPGQLPLPQGNATFAPAIGGTALSNPISPTTQSLSYSPSNSHTPSPFLPVPRPPKHGEAPHTGSASPLVHSRGLTISNGPQQSDEDRSIKRLTGEIEYYEEAIAKGAETIRERQTEVDRMAPSDRKKRRALVSALFNARVSQRERLRKLKEREEALEQARRVNSRGGI